MNHTESAVDYVTRQRDIYANALRAVRELSPFAFDPPIKYSDAVYEIVKKAFEDAKK